MSASPIPGLGEPPSTPRLMRARQLLGRHFGPSKLRVGEQECAPYARDASEAEGVSPLAVVLAENALDIELTLSVAAEAGVPVVPRGAGTGKTGGAVPVQGGIVLDLLHFGQIKEIDRRESLAVVEPGV